MEQKDQKAGFRTAFNGFNKEDVINYIETLNRESLKSISDKNELIKMLKFELTEKNTALADYERMKASFESSKKELDERDAKLVRLEQALEQEKEKYENAKTAVQEAQSLPKELPGVSSEEYEELRLSCEEMKKELASKDEKLALLEQALSQLKEKTEGGCDAQASAQISGQIEKLKNDLLQYELQLTEHHTLLNQEKLNCANLKNQLDAVNAQNAQLSAQLETMRNEKLRQNDYSEIQLNVGNIILKAESSANMIIKEAKDKAFFIEKQAETKSGDMIAQAKKSCDEITRSFENNKVIMRRAHEGLYGNIKEIQASLDRLYCVLFDCEKSADFGESNNSF